MVRTGGARSGRGRSHRLQTVPEYADGTRDDWAGARSVVRGAGTPHPRTGGPPGGGSRCRPPDRPRPPSRDPAGARRTPRDGPPCRCRDRHRPRLAGRPPRPDAGHHPRLCGPRAPTDRPWGPGVRPDHPYLAVQLVPADRPDRLHDRGRRRAAHPDRRTVGAARHRRRQSVGVGRGTKGHRPVGAPRRPHVHRVAPAGGEGGRRLPAGARPPTGHGATAAQTVGATSVMGPKAAHVAAAAQARATAEREATQARAEAQAAAAVRRAEAQAARAEAQAAKGSGSGHHPGGGTSATPPGS
jgi:hypothetical protein